MPTAPARPAGLPPSRPTPGAAAPKPARLPVRPPPRALRAPGRYPPAGLAPSSRVPGAPRPPGRGSPDLTPRPHPPATLVRPTRADFPCRSTLARPPRFRVVTTCPDPLFCGSVAAVRCCPAPRSVCWDFRFPTRSWIPIGRCSRIILLSGSPFLSIIISSESSSRTT
ncbi:spidroin-1-like [Iris pallida]|uniref:Spidroin-1-like n=1 Tax=Iris pallida TaxID=29817 RepID=A0AAX6FXS3_IRIPA|nr:spidroin-1-like [Iris pallida]